MEPHHHPRREVAIRPKDLRPVHTVEQRDLFGIQPAAFAFEPRHLGGCFVGVQFGGLVGIEHLFVSYRPPVTVTDAMIGRCRSRFSS